jgi:hypothetical protein
MRDCSIEFTGPGSIVLMASKIVFDALSHHASELDRVDRSTIASGFSSESCRQKAAVGQSTVAT